MNTFFTARHFNAREDLKDYAMASTERLKKYYDGIIDCSIVLDYNQNEKHNGFHTKIAEIQVNVYNQHLKAVETHEHFEVAIDNAVDDLVKQLKRYKETRHPHQTVKL